MRGTPDSRDTMAKTILDKPSIFMGRPKVLPQNRLRVNTACTACRASKKRCSGTFPCSNCIHKGRARSCIPFKSMVERSSQTRSSPDSQRTVEHMPIWEDLSTNVDYGSERQPEVDSRSPEAAHRTHPRMLRNLQGERGKRSSTQSLLPS